MANSTLDLIQGLRDSYDETKRAFDNDFKKLAKRQDDEKSEYGVALGQTKESLAKIEVSINKYEDLWQKQIAKEQEVLAKQKLLEEEILTLKRVGAGVKSGGKEISPEFAKFYSEAKNFSKMIRVGEERMNGEEVKALATDTQAGGGFLVPQNMANTIIRLNVLYSPVRSVADVMTISTGNTLELPKEGSTAFQALWVSERAARGVTTSGTVAMTVIPTHEMYANPFVTQAMIDDAILDVEGYVAELVGEQFGKTEGAAFINGDGVGKPQGIANGGGATVTATTSGAFTSAQLIAMQYTLEEPYASNATWLSKRANFGQIRTLTGSSGDNFLWQPGLQAGAPPTLLGSPYLSCNDITTNASSLGATDQVIYYGDWKKAYKIVDRIGVRVVRDMFTSKPYIEFYTYKRVGGQVVLPEAYKIGLAD